MHIVPGFYTSLAVASAFLSPLVKACRPTNSSSDAFALGDDGPADPATLGYTMNHFALLVNDMDAMMNFYGNILGMRHIFTYHATPTFEIVYMGYSHGGKNGTGYQTGEELFAEKTNIEGLIELISSKPKSEAGFPPTIKRLNPFSHVGLVVPDTKQIEARMQQFGVKVLKQVGKMPVPGTSAGELLERAFGVSTYSEDEQKAALDALAVIGFQDFLIVTDPDGNVLEIQDQV